MSSPGRSVTVSFHSSLAQVDQGQWNALAEGQPPFMRWEWLNLLETSGAVCPQTGWMPAHCAVHDEDRLIGAVPLYIKGHGYGEFVYDQLWAAAAHHMGLPYYPKLVAVSPFSPVAGYSFLTAPGYSRPSLAQAALAGMERVMEANRLSSLHVLFAGQDFASELEELGMAGWLHQGFLWENRGYGNFADFLADFRTGQRKNIRRERERLRDAGVSVAMVEGRDAPEAWFSLMHHYYTDTCGKFGEWGCKYLPLSFFQGLADCFREHLAFAAAFEKTGETPVGLALFAHGAGGLYGRYWGAAKDIPFLHFELCYYAAIEWAIARSLRFFDPGMGGEHKPRRGFASRGTRSLHRFRDPALAQVFERNIGQVNGLTAEHIRELQALSSFLPGRGGR